MKNLFIQLSVVFIFLVFFVLIGKAQIASNGNYTLTQTAIANGGVSGNGASLGGNYSIEGTIGQSAAGTNQQNGIYNFKPGFWTAQPPAPSAANVAVSGRVTTAYGQGIRNVRIAMSSGDGQVRYAVTGSFGFYRFDDVAAGQTYIMEIHSKRFRFEPSIRVITVMEELADVSFTAEENEN